MEAQPPARDPRWQMRVSDEDRHQVAEVLREAAGEGRLDLDELEQRLEATYGAKTYGELVPITVDLPTRAGQRQPVSGTPVPTTRWSSSVAVMSETRRSGSWIVEDGHTAFALMGSVVLDMREASFADAEVVVHAHALMGEVKVIVNSATTVVVEGAGVMGEYKEQRPRADFVPGDGGAVVRVRGLALMGSVNVQRRPRREEPRRELGA